MKNNISQKKNIVIIAPTEFPFNSSTANLLRNVSLGMSKVSLNVHLLITRGTQFVGVGEKYNRRSNYYKGIKFTYTSFKKRPRCYLFKIIEVLISMFTVPSVILIKKIRGKVDFVLLVTGYAYQNFPILVICRLLRIPIFKYSLDFYNKESVIRKSWQILKWWLFIVEIKYLDRLLNGIVVVSTKLYEYYLSNSVKKSKLIIIPSFLNIDMFSGLKYDKNALNKSKIVIGYAGAAPILNGVDDLIKAFTIVQKKFKNTELLIVGDVTGEKSQMPFLKTLAKRFFVFDKCVFTGRVDSNKVPYFLATCNILVMARKDTQFGQSGFPTKLGEYFAAKKPVIMTDVGDITNYFTDRKELMIAKADNPESVAEKIKYIIEHKDESKIIAENGYKWAKDNLDYINASKRMLTFMKENS